MKKLDHHKYYRLPWTLSDNAIAWLEPTKNCNLYCDGCYSESSEQSHKSLAEVKDEILTYKNLRNFDSLSIAGGDPLLHPDISEIVRFTAEQGLKPILNTNGLVLTEELLRDLKKVGLVGVTLHIDSKQNRPGWKGKNEVELNELRLQYAEMIHKVGGLSCGFNSTIYADSLQYVPELVRWSETHIDKVNLMVFIAFRAAISKDFDYYANQKRLRDFDVPYSTSKDCDASVSSYDLYHAIRKEFIDFESAAYLNGTADPTSTKWLLTNRIGDGKEIFGYLESNFAKIVQTFHHWKWGKYLAYPKRWVNKLGRLIMLLAPFDRGVKRSLKKYLKSIIKNPLRLFKTVHLQSIMFIQPIDFLSDGSQNMCDGCPDVTLWNGQLVWSCRLQEPLQYGCFVETKPKVDKKETVNTIKEEKKELSVC